MSQYLRHQINRRGNFRILVSPADGTVAATHAGFCNQDWPGPLLTIDSDD